MEYGHDTIHNALAAQSAHGVQRVTVYLSEGDTAWNPASTKHLIYGPTTVLYERHQDGAVVAFYGD